MNETIFTLTPGDAPVLVTIPHAGTDLAPGLRERLTPGGAGLPDTDWYMERLYAGASALGIGLLRARFSRYVIDLNRGLDDSHLYPGQAKTGLVPEFAFDGSPLYRDGLAPTSDEIETRKARYWQPYHAAIATELARLKALHGHAVLWDAHSIRSRVPRLFDGVLPDLNFGTNDGASCAPGLIARVMDSVRERGGYSDVLNGRFKGGYTTRHYGSPAAGIHAIQLEKAQTTYLASEDAPWPADDAKAGRLAQAVTGMLRAAAAWRP